MCENADLSYAAVYMIVLCRAGCHIALFGLSCDVHSFSSGRMAHASSSGVFTMHFPLIHSIVFSSFSRDRMHMIDDDDDTCSGALLGNCDPSRQLVSLKLPQ